MNSQTRATSAVCRASFGSRQAQRGSYISKLRPRSRACCRSIRPSRASCRYSRAFSIGKPEISFCSCFRLKYRFRSACLRGPAGIRPTNLPASAPSAARSRLQAGDLRCQAADLLVQVLALLAQDFHFSQQARVFFFRRLELP